MRRTAVAIGIAFIITSSLSPFASAAVKVGGACPRLNVTKVAAGSSYTCIRNGKRLVWSSGVNVPSPTPSLIAVSGPKDGDPPLPLENCGYGTYYYKSINGVTERSFYADTGYTNSDSRPDVLFDPIRVKAYHAIRDHFPAHQTETKVNFHIAHDFPPDELSLLKMQIGSTLKFWSDYFPNGSQIQASFLTEKSDSMIDDRYFTNTVDAKWILSTYVDPKNEGIRICGWRNGVAGAHVMGFGENAGQVGYWIVFPSSHDGKYWDPTNLTHEFTHGVQDIFWTKNGVMGVRDTLVAYNFTEGGGYLFGIAMSLPNIGWYQDDLYRKIVSNYLGGSALVRHIPSSTSEIIQMLKTSEKNDGDVGQTWAYTVGSQLWEWVIANYGFDAYWNIVKGLNVNQSFDEIVIKVVGKSKDNLYADAAPYILKNFQAALLSQK